MSEHSPQTNALLEQFTGHLSKRRYCSGVIKLELELTRLDGHLIVMKEGVRNAKKAQSQAALSGAIAPANDRFSRHRAKTQ